LAYHAEKRREFVDFRAQLKLTAKQLSPDSDTSCQDTGPTGTPSDGGTPAEQHGVPRRRAAGATPPAPPLPSHPPPPLSPATREGHLLAMAETHLQVADRLAATVKQLTMYLRGGAEQTARVKALLQAAQREGVLLRAHGEAAGMHLLGIGAEFALDLRSNASVMSQTVDALKVLLHGDSDGGSKRAKGAKR